MAISPLSPQTIIGACQDYTDIPGGRFCIIYSSRQPCYVIPPKPMNNLSKKICMIFLFSVAMAMLEAAVVIYLRIIFFPSHFHIQSSGVPSVIMGTELSRELATIIMLSCIGYFVGHNKTSRFAWFLIAFAIWDIFYYIFLYLFLGWPSSILGWDILFLIPVPWYGPVLSPVLVSISLIMFGSVILYAQSKTFVLHTNLVERLMMVSGCTIILFTYTYDFIRHALERNISFGFAFASFTPDNYNWTLFGVGFSLIILSILSFLSRINKMDAKQGKAIF
jgi:hypothetical protein